MENERTLQSIGEEEQQLAEEMDILKKIGKDERGRLEVVDDEVILSQVAGGIRPDTMGAMAIATAVGAGAGALVGRGSNGAKGAGTGAAVGAGAGLGISGGLVGATKLLEKRDAAKKLAKRLK